MKGKNKGFRVFIDSEKALSIKTKICYNIIKRQFVVKEVDSFGKDFKANT